ncbi:GNAT family N-acetyltransferase [Laceyella putida]|uniref:GNAT family N-acetyltransferase n=1 Tax=Laceyella putida TaxID=110101 RepID=A0ABW2RGQ3_9BACL
MSFLSLSLDLSKTVPSFSLHHPEVAIHCLAEMADSKETRLHLYQLVREGVLDDPGNESGKFESYDEFTKNIYPRCYWAQRGGVFLALAGTAWVGLSCITTQGKTGHNGLTVVTRAYRGKGIATLLKKRIIAYGVAHNLSRIMTRVAETNQAMLAINQKLGFTPTLPPSP